MTILAIETSCDDTCVALTEATKKKWLNLKILSNIVSSQVKLHAKYGGIYPSLAKREHQKNLPIVLKKALRQAQGKQIDLIAVTVGPGLEPCLWVGINFAKELAKKLKVPIVPVNHIEAHILANFIERGPTSIKLKKQVFPAVCLVVSGGHTQLILMRDFGKYRILGETRDDAAGECFDKIARILGLEYPGGPIIAKEAAESKIEDSKYDIRLPRPMIYQKNYDFSFSGLKTAVLYDFKNRSLKIRRSIGRRPTGEAKEYIRKMATESQRAIIDVLIYKTIIAAKNYKVKSIILGGGVAANEELRKQFKEKIKKEVPDTKYLIPEPKYCTDNAAMIAVTGYYQWLNPPAGGENWPEIKANANLRIS